MGRAADGCPARAANVIFDRRGRPLMFIPDNLADDGAKDDFATTARLLCIAHAATACVMALEAWAKFAKPGEKFDMAEAPSEAIDRQEVVVLMGESRDAHKQKILPIIRSGNGKFFGFGESEAPGVDELKGCFAQILPAKVAGRRLAGSGEGDVEGQGRDVGARRQRHPPAAWPAFRAGINRRTR